MISKKEANNILKEVYRYQAEYFNYPHYELKKSDKDLVKKYMIFQYLEDKGLLLTEEVNQISYRVRITAQGLDSLTQRRKKVQKLLVQVLIGMGIAYLVASIGILCYMSYVDIDELPTRFSTAITVVGFMFTVLGTVFALHALIDE